MLRDPCPAQSRVHSRGVHEVYRRVAPEGGTHARGRRGAGPGMRREPRPSGHRPRRERCRAGRILLADLPRGRRARAPAVEHRG